MIILISLYYIKKPGFSRGQDFVHQQVELGVNLNLDFPSVVGTVQNTSRFSAIRQESDWLVFLRVRLS